MVTPPLPEEQAGSAPSPAAALDTGRPPPGIAAHGRRWRSADLFGSGQEVEIEHGQAVYRLRLTSLGKLILTK